MCQIVFPDVAHDLLSMAKPDDNSGGGDDVSSATKVKLKLRPKVRSSRKKEKSVYTDPSMI